MAGASSRALSRAAALLLTGILAWAAPAASAAPRSPLDTTALWVTHAGSAESLAGQAAQAGAGTVFVKAADGTTTEPQFTPALIAGLRDAGLAVCAWTFAYGADPAGEAAAAIAAARTGAGCLVVDAEGQYDGRYGAAQVFVHALRSMLGTGFPIGLAGQAETLEHPAFPYSVFLGPGGFDVDEPQVYWRDFGLTVGGAYAATIGANAIYGRPIAPVGQLYGATAPAELERFQLLAHEYGCPGSSFFDLDVAEPAQLAALVPRPLPALRRAAVFASVRPGADGDAVVWAQELLDGAGARLPVGGFFGAETARAVARFQSRHRLRADGLLDAPTWRELLRFRAREPSWVNGPPDSARQPAAGS
ncbi:MAG: peptidoglycan-binding domain-containing protein [Solirubrobacteraceae bacterium]